MWVLEVLAGGVVLFAALGVLLGRWARRVDALLESPCVELPPSVDDELAPLPLAVVRPSEAVPAPAQGSPASALPPRSVGSR